MVNILHAGFEQGMRELQRTDGPIQDVVLEQSVKFASATVIIFAATKIAPCPEVRQNAKMMLLEILKAMSVIFNKPYDFEDMLKVFTEHPSEPPDAAPVPK